MFTGIVEERGEVRAMAGHRLTVACRVVPTDSDIGASISVNGVCLTGGGQRRHHRSTFDLSDETIESHQPTADSHEGHGVNLERPVTLSARLGGHIVQGHVDGVGEVQSVSARSGSSSGSRSGAGVASITDALELSFDSFEAVGSDLRLEAHVHRDR